MFFVFDLRYSYYGPDIRTNNAEIITNNTGFVKIIWFPGILVI